MKEKIKERKHRYLVGYPGDHQVVYGKDDKYIEPMTLFQAENMRKKMPNKGAILIRIKELCRKTK